jgi:hypothetical protein
MKLENVATIEKDGKLVQNKKWKYEAWRKPDEMDLEVADVSCLGTDTYISDQVNTINIWRLERMETIDRDYTGRGWV